jgi:hypothetical protein
MVAAAPITTSPILLTSSPNCMKYEKGGYKKRNKSRRKKHSKKVHTRKFKKSKKHMVRKLERVWIKNKTKKRRLIKRNNRTRTKRGGMITSNLNIGGINFHKETGGKYLEKNPITGEYEAHDRDCYGIGWLKWCKKKSDVSEKPWWSFW